MKLTEDKAFVASDNCKLPLRVYFLGDKGAEYAGLVRPEGSGFSLEYTFVKQPHKVLLTLGRLDDEHEVVCMFELSENKTTGRKISEYNTEKFIFSHPAANDCVRHYGHYFSFDVSCGRVIAFPSDFFMHPLLHLIPYAYWYPVSFGKEHSGYYLIGISDEDKPFFVDEKVLTEMEQNSKIYKE